MTPRGWGGGRTGEAFLVAEVLLVFAAVPLMKAA